MNPIRTRASRLRLLGQTRLRLALLLAAFAATTLTLLTSLPAHAEPTPLPSPPAAGLLDLDDCSVDGSHIRALKGGITAAPRPSTGPVLAPSIT